MLLKNQVIKWGNGREKSQCSELLTAEGQQDEAFELLEKGIANSPKDKQLSERLVKLKELYIGESKGT